MDKQYRQESRNSKSRYKQKKMVALRGSWGREERVGLRRHKAHKLFNSSASKGPRAKSRNPGSVKARHKRDPHDHKGSQKARKDLGLRQTQFSREKSFMLHLNQKCKRNGCA